MDFVRLETGHSVYINLALLQTALRSIINDQLRGQPFGIGANEYAMLRHLVQTDSALAVPDICAYLAVSRATARQVVKRLADRHFIASSREPADKRLRVWRATADGISTGLLPMPELSGELPLVRSLSTLNARDRTMLNVELQSLVSLLQSRAGEHPQTASQSPQAGLDVQQLTAFDAIFDLWLKVARAHRRIRGEQTRYLMQVSGGLLDTAAYMALYRVHEGPTNMNEISAFLRVDQNTASRIVNQLVRSGLVSRSHNPTSRREMLIAPMEKGTVLLESISGLDPTGDYIESVVHLERSGARLAHLLQRVVSGHSSVSAYNSEFLHNLIRRVFARQSEIEEPTQHQNFRLAMSEFLTGVSVITVRDETGPLGITINSLSPVSFDPPKLVFCTERSSPFLKLMQDNKSFGVSVLSSEQATSWEASGVDPFSEGLFDEIYGVPLIKQSLVGLVCDIDHIINDEHLSLVFGAPRSIAVQSNDV